MQLEALVRGLVPVAGVHARVQRARPTWRRRAAAPAPARPRRRRSRRPPRRPRCRARLGRVLVDRVGAAAVLGDHAQRRRGIHRGGADLAVAHDDRDRVVPLAQRDDVVLAAASCPRRRPRSRCSSAERLRRQVGAGDEDRGLRRSQRLPFLEHAGGAQRAVEPARRSVLPFLMSAMRCGLVCHLLARRAAAAPRRARARSRSRRRHRRPRGRPERTRDAADRDRVADAARHELGRAVRDWCRTRTPGSPSRAISTLSRTRRRSPRRRRRAACRRSS